MRIGYFIYDGVVIAVDLFSTHSKAMKAGEVRVLSSESCLKKDIYQALSGRPWDEIIERIDREYAEVKEEVRT